MTHDWPTALPLLLLALTAMALAAAGVAALGRVIANLLARPRATANPTTASGTIEPGEVDVCTVEGLRKFFSG